MNKFQQIEKLNNSNEILIKRLDNLNLQSNDISFNKKQQEIILFENLSMTTWGGYVLPTYFIYTYQFSNLQDKDLCFLKPYLILSNVSFTNSSPLFQVWGGGINFYFWEKYQSNIYILRLMLEYINDFGYIIDTKITVKIKVYQSQLFKQIKIIK